MTTTTVIGVAPVEARPKTWRELKWAKVSVGQYVVGLMDRNDFLGLEYRRFGDHGRQKYISDFESVSPIAVTLGDAQTLCTLVAMYASLPRGHEEQASDYSGSVWVGFEVRRGSTGRVISWRMPSERVVVSEEGL